MYQFHCDWTRRWFHTIFFSNKSSKNIRKWCCHWKQMWVKSTLDQIGLHFMFQVSCLSVAWQIFNFFINTKSKTCNILKSSFSAQKKKLKIIGVSNQVEIKRRNYPYQREKLKPGNVFQRTFSRLSRNPKHTWKNLKS